MMGWYPAADRVTIPSGNFMVGRDGLQPYAVVNHVTDGTAASALAWFKNPLAGVSAHFLVGRSGKVWQFVSILNTAYANGATYLGNGQWRDPATNVVRPPWEKLATYHGNPNLITISIEHEGKPFTPWTPAMLQADALLLQWIQAETGIVYRPLDTLIGHCHIGPKHRANCPGPFVDYQAQAQRGNRTAVPAPAPLRFRVRPNVTAYVREGKSREYPIALGNDPALQQELAILETGQVVDGRAIETGAAYGGENRWVWLANQIGFVHFSALEPAPL